jgi:hypothetical protein
VTSIAGEDDVGGQVIMTRQPVIFARYGKAKRPAQLGVTATTFLLLCLGIGPGPALFLIAVAAALVVWFCSAGVFRCSPLASWVSSLA